MTNEELNSLSLQIDSLLDIFEQNQPVSKNGSFNIETVKLTIIKMLDLTITDSLSAQKLKDWMESNEFWTSPASTKFHCNVKGGLAAHSLMVIYQSLIFAMPLFHNFANTKRAAQYTISASDIFIAALAHDFCKANFYATEMRKTKNYEGNWVYEPFYKVRSESRNLGHGNESVLRLLEIMPELIKNRTVLEAVSRHMGAYDLSENEGYNYTNFLQNPLVMLLQLADQTAAQWWDC